MKYIKLAILIIVMICLHSCNKLDIENGTPKCVKNKIKNFDKDQECEDGVNVKKYAFQGETVYVFNPGNCGADQVEEAIDSECNSLGNLGGISGNTEINGEDFSNAIFKSTVWEK